MALLLLDPSNRERRAEEAFAAWLPGALERLEKLVDSPNKRTAEQARKLLKEYRDHSSPTAGAP